MAHDAYELLWKSEARPARGRPATLSRERIVAEAVAIADAEGLQKVSMKHIAEALDSGVMSLYRHVPGKSELVLLMYDSLMAEPPDLPLDEGWRTAMTAWAQSVRGLFNDHPWVLPVAMSNRLMGPNEASWVDAALSAFAELDLAADLCLTVVLAVDCYVAGAVRPELQMDGEETRLLGFLGDAAARERFPNLARLVTEVNIEDSNTLADYFDFGLERLLDGIEAFLEGE